jgi:crotonobetainyl-CoA:carnitine CoA-transferase CaiB-like acyl-CoA transferase
MKQQVSDGALLSDLRVLEIGVGVAVAACGKLFADAGAEVLKLSEEGDPLRRQAPFDSTGRLSLLAADLDAGKKRVALDKAYKDPLQFIAGFAPSFDIIIVGGLSFGRKGSEIFNLVGGEDGGKVVVGLSTFGETGPYAAYRGGDLVATALGGFMHMMGDPERGPVMLGGHQAERSAGASGFTGALAAHFGRLADRMGRFVEVSSVETMAYMEWKADIYEQADGVPRGRGAPSQWFNVECRDGKLAFIYENPDWDKVLKLIGDDRLANARFATRDGRLAHHAEATAIVQDWAGKLTKKEAYHLAQKAGIPAGLVADMKDVYESPQYVDTGFLGPAEVTGLGSFNRPGIPYTVDGMRPSAAESAGERQGRS